jgi:hypothetical protein
MPTGLVRHAIVDNEKASKELPVRKALVGQHVFKDHTTVVITQTRCLKENCLIFGIFYLDSLIAAV